MRPIVASLSICSLVLLVLLSGTISREAHAQSGGHISVFADPFAGSCTLLDTQPALFNVYIVHTGMAADAGIIGSGFMLVQGPGFTASFVSEAIAVPGHVGSVLTGLTLAYDGCLFGTRLLATVTFQGHGTSSACSYLDTGPRPYPWETEPVAQDCIFALHPAPSSGKLYINAESGLCQPGCAVATRATTWGGVKSLYRK